MSLWAITCHWDWWVTSIKNYQYMNIWQIFSRQLVIFSINNHLKIKLLICSDWIPSMGYDFAFWGSGNHLYHNCKWNFKIMGFKNNSNNFYYVPLWKLFLLNCNLGRNESSDMDRCVSSYYHVGGSSGCTYSGTKQTILTYYMYIWFKIISFCVIHVVILLMLWYHCKHYDTISVIIL